MGRRSARGRPHRRGPPSAPWSDGRWPPATASCWPDGRKADPAGITSSRTVPAAEQRAATERLGPATEGIDGIVSVTRMRATDNAYLVVVLAESMDAFDVASQAVTSTELLPGEDPELLGGPDRVGFYRLVHADLPITEGSPA